MLLARLKWLKLDRNIRYSTSNLVAGLEALKEKTAISTDYICENQSKLIDSSIPEELELKSNKSLNLQPNYQCGYFLEPSYSKDLNYDGYLNEFVPDVPFTRRVWSKGSLTFIKDNPMQLNTKINLKTYLASYNINNFNFTVNLTKEYSNLVGKSLIETRSLTYIYDKYDESKLKSIKMGKQLDYLIELEADSLQLFKYSALTFNSHKVHYDYLYSKEVEGYPNVLVQGPYILTLMLRALTKVLNSNNIDFYDKVESISYTLIKPTFVNQKFKIGLKLDAANGVFLYLTDQTHFLNFKGYAKFFK